MEKRLIVSMAIGEKSKRYGKITFPLIEAYAKKCNADFLVVTTEDPQFEYIGYQKWKYVNYLDTYDRVLHIDADMVVKSNTPNLFDLVAYDEFAGVDEQPFACPQLEVPYVDRFDDLKMFKDVNPKFYINVGMYLFSRTHRNLFDNNFLPALACHFKEQTHLNYLLHKQKYKVHLLDPRFNTMSIMENHGLKRSDAYIIHYAGGWRGYPEEIVKRMMKVDYV